MVFFTINVDGFLTDYLKISVFIGHSCTSLTLEELVSKGALL